MTEKDLDTAIEKCERIMEFDTRTMQNPVSENGHIFEKVYELLKFLRQLQFATDTNVGGTNDTISRQTVLDAVDGVTWYHQNKHGEMVSGANDDEHQAWYKAEDIYKAIESVQSAQPDNIGEVTEMVGDTISRAKAIEAMRKAKDKSELHRMLVQLPSAQPGWIPCGVALPKKEGVYLVTDKIAYGEKISMRYWNIHEKDAFWSGYESDVVTAWMPLPTPYREGGQE